MNMFFDENIFKDNGNKPCVIPLKKLTYLNDNYRVAVWTGTHLQITVMNILPNDDIGGEVHENLDQFLYIERGRAKVLIGESKDKLSVMQYAGEGEGILIPANNWHDVINVGMSDLKVFSVYAPVQHPYGTVQENKPEED